MTINDFLRVNAQMSVDGKQYKYDGLTHVPWSNAAEYLAAIPTPLRHKGQIAFIANGTSQDIWYFENGTNDSDFKKYLGPGETPLQILFVDNPSDRPSGGSIDKIYVIKSTKAIQIWDGTQYVNVGNPGPIGPKGDTGDTGATGATGATGPEGDSAYQVWLDAGNSGTVSDFLYSLIGPTGPAGSAGQGVPAGGTTGQVLKKKTASDYDTEWANETGSGGSLPSGNDGEFLGREDGMAKFMNIYTADVKDAAPAMITDVTLKEFLSRETNWAGNLCDATSLSQNGGHSGQMHYVNYLDEVTGVTVEYMLFCVSSGMWRRTAMRAYYGGVPFAVTKLAFWIDAANSSSIIRNSNGVYMCEDLSLNNLNLTNEKSVDSITYDSSGLNSKGIIKLDKSNMISNPTSLFNGIAAQTLYVVFKPRMRSPSTIQPIFSVPSESVAMSWLAIGGDNKLKAGGRRVAAQALASVSSSAVMVEQFYIIKVEFDWLNKTLKMHVDGVIDASSSSFQDGGLLEIPSATNVLVGAVHNGLLDTQDADHEIGEIIVYNKILSPLEDGIVTNYLTEKWGL